MATMTILQAVNQALREAMHADGDVLVLGEDVGRDGGVFRATEGLFDEFGESRVIDTPLSESGIIGTAIGMALYGLRPVPEIQFQDFIYPAFDQIVSEAAKMRYRSGGQYTCPMTIRTPVGGGIRGGHYHSQSGEAHFIHTAGLKVVLPSTPHDTKGLLLAAIQDEDPVLFLEPKRIYRAVRGEVPEGIYTVPIGEARIAREGTDVTLVTYGAMVYPSLEAAGTAAEQGWTVEVVDLRSLMPWDVAAVLRSVSKTGRLVIVNEAPLHCGFAAEIAAQVAERAIEFLKGPIVRVTGFDTPFPYALEGAYLPDGPRIHAAIEKVMRFDD